MRQRNLGREYGPWALLMMASVAASPACGEGLEPTGRITKARIVGVRSVVLEEPRQGSSRTDGRPGETVEVTFLVTQPGVETLSSWAFVICMPATTTFGIARCREGEPLALVSSMTPSTEAPLFTFQIPEGANSDLLYVGAVCFGGELGDLGSTDDAAVNANPCAGDGVGRLVTGALNVQGEGTFENHAPSIERVTLRGESWTATVPALLPSAAEGCRNIGLPSVSRLNGDVADIEVFPSENSRERDDESVGAELEELPVAFFSTERGLSRFYSVIEDRRPHAEANFDTSLITDSDALTIPADGRVVRFEFVMRDDHGGVDLATRALCLLP